MIAQRHVQGHECADERDEGMLCNRSEEARLGDGEAGAEHGDDDAREDERIRATDERGTLDAAAYGERSDGRVIREARGEVLLRWRIRREYMPNGERKEPGVVRWVGGARSISAASVAVEDGAGMS